MQVVILCGGKGTRLREETEYRPKPMVSIGGRPILWHVMKIYAHFGFTDFVLCLGYKQEVIRDFFLNYHLMTRDLTVHLGDGGRVDVHPGSSEAWTVTLVDTGEESRKGKRLKLAEPYLTGSEFFMTYGDGVADVDIKALYEDHKRAGAKVTFTGVHPTSRFGTVRTDAGGRVVDWEEKARVEGFVSGGFFVIDRTALEYIDGDVEFEEEPMRRLAREGAVAMHVHEGFWQCMDTYRDYQILEDLWSRAAAPWKVWRD